MSEAEEKQLFGAIRNTGIDFSSYTSIEVKVDGRGIATPPQAETFEDMKLHQSLMANIARMGYTTPTPIQKASVPITKQGRDIIAVAQTGSGKTGAFMFATIIRCMRQRHMDQQNPPPSGYGCFPKAMVMTPTRELAIQILEEAKKFSFRLPLKTCIAYGGQPRGQQAAAFRDGCDIVIGTPGRLNDFSQSRTLDLSRLIVLCLDEADRMLDMGFLPQIRQIIRDYGMPRAGVRQTLMFSATFPREIQQLAHQFLAQSFAFISIGRVGSTTDLITQQLMNVPDFKKRDAVMDLIVKYHTAKRILIFAERKTTCHDLEGFLTSRGLHVTSIHGDKPQEAREFALNEFKRGAIKILVATDVASRGLDVDGIDLVINHDTPNDIDSYTHRIGRTGRCGRKGLAISFVNDRTNPRVLLAIGESLRETGQGSPVLDELLRYGNYSSRGGGGRGGGRRY
jgi:ATP-dependent RNA helicase DDX3X